MSDEQISRLIERMAQAKGVNISPELVKEAVKRVVVALSESSKDSQTWTGKGLDPKKDYPLAQKRPDLVQTGTGLSLNDITLGACPRMKNVVPDSHFSCQHESVLVVRRQKTT
jgi:hypothetical protein